MKTKQERRAQRQQKYNEIIEDEKIKRSFKDQLKSIRVDTFTKALVGIIIIMAVIDLQLSYVLAFLDKIQIAEELSKQVCTTILGVALVYMIRAYFDSRAEYNNKNLKSNINDFINSKVSSILNEGAGTQIIHTETIEEPKEEITEVEQNEEEIDTNDIEAFLNDYLPKG